jgi:hypothetical protein
VHGVIDDINEWVECSPCNNHEEQGEDVWRKKTWVLLYYDKVWNYLKCNFDEELKIQQQSHGGDLLVQLAFKLTYSLQVTSQHFDRTNEHKSTFDVSQGNRSMNLHL